MSFLNWFSGKPRPSASPLAEASADDKIRRGARPEVSMPQRIAADSQTGDERKVKRHARREQLYVAIREAMTRAGVLSASYKFKVLSLDQRGNEFLVMMDVSRAFGHTQEQLAKIEPLIVQNAKARFEITVPAVYWRIDEHMVVPEFSAHTASQTAALHVDGTHAATPAKPAKPRYEPIQADEVAAFKQALMAASAQGPAVAAPENGVKTRSGPRSYTLLTGFEDTEMPESAASPALSSTQYGDLH